VAGIVIRYFTVFLATSAFAAPDLAEVEALIARGTNQFRSEQGRPRVAPDAALARAARGFADYMARTDNYGHRADGKEPAERARARGYDYCMIAENIAYHFSSEPIGAAEVTRLLVEGWKESPGHRKNLLEPSLTDTGIAVSQSSRTGRIYAVQMFGRPRSRMVAFRVSNMSRRPIEYRVAGKPWSLQPSAAREHTTCVPEEVSFVGAANEKGRTVRPSGGENFVASGDARITIQQR
jgi:uncharacterized protein YkwD